VLRQALEPFADRIAIAFIYGSLARREEKAENDIDLMAVGKVSLEDVLGSVGELEQSLARAINPTVYSPPEFKAKLAGGNHFLNSVMRGEKIFLIGDERELKSGRSTVGLSQNLRVGMKLFGRLRTVLCFHLFTTAKREVVLDVLPSRPN
jgi:predicted nucleotidyltransferase